MCSGNVIVTSQTNGIVMMMIFMMIVLHAAANTK